MNLNLLNQKNGNSILEAILKDSLYTVRTFLRHLNSSSITLVFVDVRKIENIQNLLWTYFLVIFENSIDHNHIYTIKNYNTHSTYAIMSASQESPNREIQD